jgi:hypothetical protein
MLRRFLIVFAGVCVVCAPLAEAAEQVPFRAGAAKSNITPSLGEPIIGGFHPFPAKHVHDELWAKCLVLESGTTRVALVVCDLLGLSHTLCDEARRLVQETTEIPMSHVLVSATHTHSACSALGERYDLAAKLSPYQQFVARRVADAVRCAVNNLEPAKIGWTTADVPQHVFCRRWFLKPGTMPVNPFGNTNDLVKMNPARGSKDLVRPAGPTDPQVAILGVQSREGRPLALFANYSLHYVGGVRGADISADYYGIFDARMRELLDAERQSPEFLAIMSNGTSGNINNIDFTRQGERYAPYARMREVAYDVAAAVHAAYQTIEWRDQVPLGAAFEEIDLAFRRPTPEQLQWAKDTLAKLGPETKPKTLGEIYAARTMGVQSQPERARFALQAFRIGDVGITTFPNEVFSEIGLELKKRNPFKPSFTISLAHGYFGYLPTPEQHALGGYETWLGTSRLEIEASVKMIDQLLRMLESLK